MQQNNINGTFDAREIQSCVTLKNEVEEYHILKTHGGQHTGTFKNDIHMAFLCLSGKVKIHLPPLNVVFSMS